MFTSVCFCPTFLILQFFILLWCIKFPMDFVFFFFFPTRSMRDQSVKIFNRNKGEMFCESVINYSYLSDHPRCFWTTQEKTMSLSDVELLGAYIYKQHYTCEAVLDFPLTRLPTSTSETTFFWITSETFLRYVSKVHENWGQFFHVRRM